MGREGKMCGHQAQPCPIWTKNRHFRRFFSSVCLHVCKYLSARPTPGVHPIGSYLCEKSCSTSLQYLVPKKSQFFLYGKRRFPPPGERKRPHPLTGWSRFLKIPLGTVQSGRFVATNLLFTMFICMMTKSQRLWRWSCVNQVFFVTAICLG